ncbi:hypothetical protein LCGC14_0429110 [marine sediment metagenome]|uniref:Uncharacterized protein n=1 Tax=marine sediment metagenome TaxID=412755 RepID=A0A0F9VY38_9ZZZZ
MVDLKGDSDSGEKRGTYLPTPDQIAEETAKIRDRWKDRLQRKPSKRNPRAKKGYAPRVYKLSLQKLKGFFFERVD